jgi:hypothetical protein
VCLLPYGRILIRRKNCRYFTQKNWVSGLFSIVGYSKEYKHDVSEIESSSVLRWSRGEDTTLLGPLELIQWLRLGLSKGLNWVGVFSPTSLEDGDRSFRNVMFLFLRVPDDGKKSKNPIIMCALHLRQDPYDLSAHILFHINFQKYSLNKRRKKTALALCDKHQNISIGGTHGRWFLRPLTNQANYIETSMLV